MTRTATQDVGVDVTHVGVPKNEENTEIISKKPVNARIGHIVINEIAWNGSTHSSSDEWVELYNNDSFIVDISGWHLRSSDDSPSFVFPEGSIVGPNSYFLIERTDDLAISNLTADLAISFGSGLKDSGEALFLERSDGVISDFVGTGESGWLAGGKRRSMERNTPNQPSSLANWHTFSGSFSPYLDGSGNVILGTPKMANSPVPALNPSPTPTSTPSPSPSPTQSSSGGSSSGGSSGGSGPQANSQEDDDIAEEEPEIEVGDLGQIYINEIGWMGTLANASDEWIELYNPSSASFSLNGWQIVSETDDSPHIVLTGEIDPFGYFLIERTDDNTISNIEANMVSPFGTGGLKNEGENIVLLNHLGEVVDSAGVDTGWLAGDAENHTSMERLGYASGSWTTYGGAGGPGLDAEGNLIFGTPGLINCNCFEPLEEEPEEETGPEEVVLSNPWRMYGGDAYHTQYIADGFNPTSSLSTKWEKTMSQGIGQPVIGVDGVMKFGTGSAVSAISYGGNILSTINSTARPSVGSIGQENSYFGHYDPGFSVISVSNTGSTSWVFEINDRVDKITMDSNENIFFTSENNRVTALNKDGSLKWQVANTSVFSSAPIVVDGQVIVSGRLSGVAHIYSYDIDNGDLLWEQHFDGGCLCGVSDLSYDSEINKILLVSGSSLLFINTDGSGFVSAVIEENGVGSGSTMVAIGGDTLFIGFDISALGPEYGSRIIAINKSDLSVKWVFDLGGTLNLQLAVNGEDSVFFATRSGLLGVLDTSGNLSQSYASNEYSEISPVLTRDGVIWGHGDKIVFIGD